MKLGNTEDLARKLVLGQGGRIKTSLLLETRDPLRSWGKAVFMVGAGCSASAGIPLAAGIARHCAVALANAYRTHDEPDWSGHYEAADGDRALAWLVQHKGVPDLRVDGLTDWQELYSEFFENHLGSPNQQRAVITEVIERAEHRLNWAHICLGELVRLRYVHTVLTTNFDPLALKGLVRAGVLPVVVEGLEGLNRVTAEPRHPQLVHLHGSVHTYDTKNTKASVMGTEGHGPLNSMLYTVLQQCDVLVVVGYAGGEEGVMTLLDRAASELPNLVVYWIMYDSDQARLSSKAAQLLDRGENKFLVTGMDADRLFKELMNELKVGLPRWIREPVSTIKDLINDLAPVPVADADPDVRAVLEAFKEQVGTVAIDSVDVAGRVAAMRLRGDYLKALEALRDAESGLILDRLSAMTKYELAQVELKQDELAMVVRTFEAISGQGSSRERLVTLKQLLPALVSLHELTSDDALLEQAIFHCDIALSLPDISNDARAEMELRKALCLQVLGERNRDGDRLAQALGIYEQVETARNASRDSFWSEAKTGAATVSQALGEMLSDVNHVRRAVASLNDLVGESLGGIEPLTEAARRFNLAGALVSLAALDPPSGPRRLLEAEVQLMRALELYEQAGDSASAQAALLLETVRKRMGGS